VKVRDGEVVINLDGLCAGEVTLSEALSFVEKALEADPEGAVVVLQGDAPTWVYLFLAHVLHGLARKLYYDSPVYGRILIFDHSPFDEHHPRTC